MMRTTVGAAPQADQTLNILLIEEAQAKSAEATAREIAREMAVLQAVVAIPLASHGQLVGILTLGQRITGGAYGRRETETLFNLASHLATSIRDIRVHHQLHQCHPHRDHQGVPRPVEWRRDHAVWPRDQHGGEWHLDRHER